MKTETIGEIKSNCMSVEDKKQDTPISCKNSEVESKNRPLFIGDINSLKKYVAAAYRNKVNAWAKSEREKQNGICEYCGKKAEL